MIGSEAIRLPQVERQASQAVRFVGLELALRVEGLELLSERVVRDAVRAGGASAQVIYIFGGNTFDTVSDQNPPQGTFSSTSASVEIE